MSKPYKGDAKWALHKLTYAVWMALFKGIPPHLISTGPRKKEEASCGSPSE